MGSFLSGITGTNNGYVAEGAPITKQDFTQDLSSSANQFNTIFGQQGQLAGMLQQQAMGQGPNPAEMQLKQDTNRNISQATGMVASNRGLSPALAARLAAQNAASIGQQSVGQGALMGAQQQLSARGQLAGLLGQQQQGALGMNQNLQTAQAAQNNALVGMQSNLNNANAATAAGNQKNNAGLVGGLLGGVSGALGFAQGGQIPHLAEGGPVSSIGQFFSGIGGGGNANPYGGAFSALGKGLHGLFSSGEQSDEDAQEGYADANSQLGMGTQNPLFQGMEGFNTEVQAPASNMMPGMGFAAKGGTMEPMGKIPGQAPVAGDSLANDKVPIMASPGEIMIPRSITMHPNAPEMAAQFVRQELEKHHHQKKNYADGGVVDTVQKFLAPAFYEADQATKSKTHTTNIPQDGKAGPSKPRGYADGGQIPDGLNANAPQTELQPVSAGFDPGQAFLPAAPQDYGHVYENIYQDLRKTNPGEPESFSRATAENAAIGAKKSDEFKVQYAQEKAQASQQQMHDQAVAENAKRQALGLKPVPIPQAPVQISQQMPEQGAPNPALNNIPDMTAMSGGAGGNAFSQMNQSLLGGYQKAANEQKAGFAQAAQVQDVLGKQNAAIAHQQMEQDRKINENYQNLSKQYMGEYSAAMEDYKNGHINPNHYAESMSSVGKVKTAIGLILGGLSSGLTGQENPAMKFLNSQIDRDIAAQREELGKKQNLLTANFHKMGNLRDATEMTRAMMMGIQANQFREAAANAQGPMAKATALQEAGKIDERIAPIMGQIAMRQTVLGAMGNQSMDPSQKVRYLSMSGMMPPDDKGRADKELAMAGELNALKKDLRGAANHIHAQAMNGVLSPKDTVSAKMAIAGRLVKLTEGRFNQEAAMNVVDAFFPTTFETAQTTANKIQRGEKTLDGMMQTPVLDQYGIKVKQAPLPAMAAPKTRP